MPKGRNRFRKNIFRNLLTLLKSVLVNIYFTYWSYKVLVRDVLKYGSLSIASLSTIILAIDVLAESFGSKRIQEVINSLSKSWIVGWISLSLFVLSVAYLCFHHWEEAKKPNYEYTFVKRLHDFMEGRRVNVGET